MQTFLPYSNFKLTAKCLDYRRLGKQRLEAKQILNILLGRTTTNGWRNHPAVCMWRGYEEQLKYYYNTILSEWIERGYNNTMLFEDTKPVLFMYPGWLDHKFCLAHRSNLLRKDPTYYGQFNWNIPDNLPYIWPTHENLHSRG